ncbi:hypothetical protein RRG08_014309 [Elysia crispata]|uniref:Uncharacterized protein n=1 Tax=Elysia crispata TaxID=231223 RepID=A0AAE0Z1X7_9GAST|nr:hypothetical protein RRG08_014309 [Elysia crispata]
MSQILYNQRLGDNPLRSLRLNFHLQVCSSGACRRFNLYGEHTGHCCTEWFYTMTVDQPQDSCLALTKEFQNVTQSFAMFFYSTTSATASLDINQSKPILFLLFPYYEEIRV